MFCPKCGVAEQSPETYCRQCGQFLPDPDKPSKKEITPAEHVRANTVLSLTTIVISFTLSFLLFYFFLGLSGTSPLIYVSAGFLFAIGCWHIQTFWRSLMLRKYFKRQGIAGRYRESIEGRSAEENRLLDQANFEDVVPASVTDRTTRKLEDSHSSKAEKEPDRTV